MVPLVLALFPAAALLPAVERLVRLRVPRAVAALLLVVAVVLAVLVGVIAGLIPRVVDQVPAVADAVVQATGQLEQTLRRLPFDVEVSSLRELVVRVAGGGADGIVGSTLLVTTRVAEFLAGTLLLLVALFFYLQDGPRMAHSALGLLPEHTRELAREIGCRLWATVGSYFRGLLLVAAVDAVFIGAGLLLLGVPLALPLAALVFLGALFPIIGAVLATLLAALVARGAAAPVPRAGVGGGWGHRARRPGCLPGGTRGGLPGAHRRLPPRAACCRRRGLKPHRAARTGLC